ncbi:Carbohydrate-selective porin, OprB family [Terriglobus roseus]|uniref:Carbohydrate-selective porin, OprB family n=2 Tax=Terriglobus roseus TaxID=392734 RepID=A0A1H4Q005_9BACT|nr:Carbohydrate-selective porin, OprB family [Terriglobus roseus]
MIVRRWVVCALLAAAPLALAQAPASRNPPAQVPIENAPPADTAPALFPHTLTKPWYIAGQANSILQAHGAFHSPYEGVNSLRARGEYKVSLLGTVYLGLQPWQLLAGADSVKASRYNTDFLVNVEAAGGRGISQALGLAGFTNLDVVRNPTLGSKPYIARLEVHQTIGFTDAMTDNTRGPLSLATKVPVRRLEFRAGKMSTPDVFDLNSVLSDSHLQFTNWSIDNNGAWDYAADTRGYTYGATLEYQDRDWAVRYGLMLMPTVANGIDLDWAVKRSRGQNVEAELRHGFLPGKKGTQRVLAFVNTAHMGSYREAVQAYLRGTDATPDITLHEHTSARKYGFGYNMEQAVTDDLTVAARFGWNDGKTESFAYTEIEQTALVGASYDGKQWGRKNDKVGLAFSSNAIKRDHQQYLANGGLGFILGDGHLRYGRENIVEGYYNLHLWRGSYFAAGGSHINNPGYNRDRGPVWVPSLRMHMDF